MTYWLSSPIEALLASDPPYLSKKVAENAATEIFLRTATRGVPVAGLQQRSVAPNTTGLPVQHCPTVIIGSGYGAAMSALALAEGSNGSPRPPILVLERGNEFLPDDFPKTIGEAPGNINFVNGSREASTPSVSRATRNLDTGLWDIRLGTGVASVTGIGLGGGSLINANVAMDPVPETFVGWPTCPGGDWYQFLQPALHKIKSLLGVRPVANPEHYAKYEALQKVVNTMGGKAEAANLSINRQGPTVHSADHGPCNDCGNCVIGCHSGAKGSLNMNAWPLARQLGVELYTGANVTRLSNNRDGTWEVHCTSARDVFISFSFRAARVILGAGALGSTEILFRSKKTASNPDGVALSAQLGKKFSTNGDALIFGAGQKQEVNAAAPLPQPKLPAGTKAPGPTIIGKASIPLRDLARKGSAEVGNVVLEDGAVPYPLVMLWRELITTQLFIKNVIGEGNTAWHSSKPDVDPISAPAGLAIHSQVLLAMGKDNNANGQLTLHGPTDSVIPNWEFKQNSENDYFIRLDKHLQQAEKNGGFDGGRYLPNPAWKPLPDGFDSVLEGGDKLPRTLVTVHPLGGCAIGENSDNGVVNCCGQVFDVDASNNTTAYDNLYVLDGSIIPAALGINPFLTISALAYTLAAKIAGHSREQQAREFPDLVKFRTIPKGALSNIPDPASTKVTAVFSERLTVKLAEHPGLREKLGSVGIPSDHLRPPPVALVVDIQFYFGGKDGNPRYQYTTLADWLEKPDIPLEAEAIFHWDMYGYVDTTPNSHLTRVGRMQGTVNLGTRKKPAWIGQTLLRILMALWRFIKFRPYDIPLRMKEKTPLSTAWLELKKFFLAAKFHTTFRYLDYKFENGFVFECDSLKGKTEAIVLKGRKKFAYSRFSENLLCAYITLPIELRNKTSKKSVAFTLAVDLLRMTKHSFPLQILSTPNSPIAMEKLFGALMFFTRSALQTHFWSFAAPSYSHFQTRAEIEGKKPAESQPEDTNTQTKPAEASEWKYPNSSRLAEPDARIRYRVVATDPSVNRWSTPVEEFRPDVDLEKGNSRLIRYQPADAPETRPQSRRTLLLIHGLAHSSRVFWADTMPVNFVQYFLSCNYDVWILDHRTSASIKETIDSAHTWDQIATIDIPWAVTKTYQVINGDDPAAKKKIHLFSHCIGAGATSMAVLAGLLSVPGSKNPHDSMLASLVPHAVTPWLYGSYANRVRENVWAFFKELGIIKLVEPLPHNDPDAVDMLFDRLAAAQLDQREIGWWKRSLLDCRDYKDKRGPGFPRTIYNRYTIFWGKQWNHAHINDDTRFGFGKMIGASPSGVLQQVYFSITKGILSNKDGANIYVRKKNFDDYWTFPTLFLHGTQNNVFNFNSSRLSAMRLTQLRMQAKTRMTVLPTPDDYEKHKVYIEILEDYGHMDVILGENAYNDVFLRLHEFFSNVEPMASKAEIKSIVDGDKKAGGKNAKNPRNFAPVIRHGGLPKTGPIISLTPGISGSIRVWLEANDFSDLPLDEVIIEDSFGHRLFRDPGTRPNQRHFYTPRQGDTNCKFVNEEFLLFDYAPVNTPRHTLNLFLKYKGDPVQSFPQRNQTPSNVAAITAAGFLSAVAAPSWKSTSMAFHRNDHRVPLDWPQLPWFKRLSQSNTDDEQDELSFLAGSCLHPGLPFEHILSSSIFTEMDRHVVGYGKYPGIDHLVLLGDQIYADATANLFDPLTLNEKYRLNYRLAWASGRASKLFAHVPSYFVMDDHEYSNNWQGKYPGGMSREELDAAIKEQNFAIDMGRLFQMHRTRAWRQSHCFWYDFRSRGYPFFVMDTRFERPDLLNTNGRILMGPEQLAAFETWLTANRNSTVLFLCSGSPITPIKTNMQLFPALHTSADNLLAYPDSLHQIATLLARYVPDKKIVWLAGDPHFSSIGKLSFSSTVDGLAVTIHQICASGLYSPFPFTNDNPNSHVWNWQGQAQTLSLPIQGNKGSLQMEYWQGKLCADVPHFVRVDVRKDDNGNLMVTTAAFDATGLLHNAFTF